MFKKLNDDEQHELRVLLEAIAKDESLQQYLKSKSFYPEHLKGIWDKIN